MVSVRKAKIKQTHITMIIADQFKETLKGDRTMKIEIPHSLIL